MENITSVIRKQQEGQSLYNTYSVELKNGWYNIDKYKKLFKIYKRCFKLTINAKNTELYNELLFLLRERSQYYNTIKEKNPLKNISRRTLLAEAHLQAMLLCYVSFERKVDLAVKAWFDLIYNDKHYLSRKYMDIKDILVCLTLVFMQKMDKVFNNVIDEMTEIFCPYIPEKESDYYCLNEFVKEHKDTIYRINTWDLKAVDLKRWEKKNLSFEDWRLFTNDFCKDSTTFFLHIIDMNNADVDLHAIVDIMESHLMNDENQNIIELKETWNESHEFISYLHDYIDKEILKEVTQNLDKQEQKELINEESLRHSDNNKNTKRKAGRKPAQLLGEEYKNIYASLFVNFLKEHQRFSIDIDFSQNNYVNKAFCVFYRKWKKQGIIVREIPNGHACFRFLKNDCGLKLKKADEKTYANYIRDMIRNTSLDLFDIKCQIDTYLEMHKDRINLA